MPAFTTRPVVRGSRAVLTSGHYLATACGLRMIERGGNAFDAAAAMAFCLMVLEPHNNGIGGEVPILLYSARDREAFAVSGQGFAPAAFTIDWCRVHGIDLIPGDGYLPACVPGMVGAWATVLARWGTKTFAEVLQGAIELADRGFPMYEWLEESLGGFTELITRMYPTTASIYLPEGRPLPSGKLMRNPDLAWTLRQLVAAEAERGASRIAGIEAACDAFYRGEIAQRIVQYISENPVADASGQSHFGLLTLEDLAVWRERDLVERPVRINHKGLDVCKCNTWTQGVVFQQQLRLLGGFDLPAMGHNSCQYLHVLTECAKLAFADREAYYGDPEFDRVPLEALLRPEYADQRRALVGAAASLELRPGDVGNGVPDFVGFNVVDDNRRAMGMAPREKAKVASPGDTTHLDAADSQGNMIAATPSGGWIQSSPVIPGLGFPLGTRGQMFYLNARRPNALEGRKRPRATLTPTLVLKDERPLMAFGTQGGDSQDQWTLQFFLNHTEFKMNLQQALDAPLVHSLHFPSSFYPREGKPGRLDAQPRIAAEVIAEMRRLGHDVQLIGDWANGKVMCVQADHSNGTLLAAASPNGNVAYALGW